ncbi:zinc finger CCHC domain-containing protein 7-like [Drosophila suzukii]|uniref:Zinc finger CCHC domain-containing protein 7-like n=1 Tax=Drosophila suzukii TaxID=28584 RepID=A0ABM4TVZ2_DROSZ
MQLHIFQNLRFDQLLGGNEVEDPEESDEDRDDDEENQSDDEIENIASRGNVEEDALIQYVIDGIDELSINKSMLYGATNMTEFKYKLKDYQTISAKSHFGENSAKEKKAQAVHGGSKTGKKEIVCYNCGEKGHLSSGCNNKEKGRKCFKCNKFGHISKSAPKATNQSKSASQTRVF